MAPSPSCDRCGEEVEDMQYYLFLYPLSILIWDKIGLKFRMGPPSLDIERWLKQMLLHDKFLAGFWWIWI